MNFLKEPKIIIIILTILIYILLGLIFKKILENKNNKNLGILFLFNSLKTLTIIIGIIFYLSQFKEFDNILTVLINNSALLVATLGFAFQNTIKNILAGILLVSSDAFKTGDKVKILENHLTGTIKEITLRHTVIELVTKEIAIVPNSILNDSIVINNDFISNEIGYPLIITIPINSDIERAIEIMEEEIKNNSLLINKEKSQVILSHIDLNRIDLKVIIWNRSLENSFKEIKNLKLKILKKYKEEKII